MAILDDLEQVAAFGGSEHGQAPIVQDQKVSSAETFEEPGVTPVPASEREGFEQPRDAMIEDGAIVAASLVAEGTG
jgi:hypothetical protein